jgi:hypothetical protein
VKEVILTKVTVQSNADDSITCETEKPVISEFPSLPPPIVTVMVSPLISADADEKESEGLQVVSLVSESKRKLDGLTDEYHALPRELTGAIAT